MQEARGLKHTRDEDDHQKDDRDDRKGSRDDRPSKRLRGNEETSERRRHDSRSPSPHERNVRTQILGSTIGAVVAATSRNRSQDEDHKPSTETTTSSLESKKALIEDTYKKPETLGRNKRMFGSLMGHLGLAKNNLDKELQKINKQQQLLLDLTKKQEEESLRRDVQRQKDKKKEIYDRNVQEVQSLAAKHREYLESLQFFLFTQTEPKLAWLPVNHNKQSKEMLLRRQEEILREVAEREIADSKKLQVFQDQYQDELLKIEEYFAQKQNDKQRVYSRSEGFRSSRDEADGSQYQDNRKQDSPEREKSREEPEERTSRNRRTSRSSSPNLKVESNSNQSSPHRRDEKDDEDR